MQQLGLYSLLHYFQPCIPAHVYVHHHCPAAKGSQAVEQQKKTSGQLGKIEARLPDLVNEEVQ